MLLITSLAVNAQQAAKVWRIGYLTPAFIPRASFQVKGGQAERMVLISYEPTQPGDPAAKAGIKAARSRR